MTPSCIPGRVRRRSCCDSAAIGATAWRRRCDGGTTIATIQKRGKSWQVQYYHQGRRHSVSVGPLSTEQAEARRLRVEEQLRLLGRGMVEVPEWATIDAYIKHDGRPPRPDPPPEIAAGSQQPAPGQSLGDLAGRYLEAKRLGWTGGTAVTARQHLNHWVRSLGAGAEVAGIGQAELQAHVDCRAGLGIGPETIAKELVTLKAAWKWGRGRGLVGAGWPEDAVLVLPRGEERRPFATYDEIASRVARERLKGSLAAEAWRVLYLQPGEVAELLDLVEARAGYPWIYPLLCLAAHTGMRRSELIRARVGDVDLAGLRITVREVKRVKGRSSTREAPLTDRATRALEAWMAAHPGGEWLFCQAGVIAHSSRRSRTTGHKNGPGRPSTAAGRKAGVVLRGEVPGPTPLTPDVVADHLARTLRGTRWEVLPGLHALRHSFISALAAAGVDQRRIDAIVGHTSEAIRRRYRHTTPEARASAVDGVFG